MKKILWKSVLLIAASLAFFACDDDDSKSESVKVVLDQTELSLTIGASKTLVATVTPVLAPGKSVTWASDNTAVVTVQDGVVTAVGSGDAVITASVGTSQATCKVTVAAVAISLDQTAFSLMSGFTQTLVATVTPPLSGEASVVWASDNEAVATVADGVVTAVGAGEAVITASVGESKATCNVTVTTVTVALNRTEFSLEVGSIRKLVATVTPPLEGETMVAWASDNEAVATVADGVVTALTEGNATITASVGASTATCAVTVTAALPIPKIGDYYYSDGTWSDGGLVSIDANGLNPVWAASKPAPLAGKTVVGIVFQNDKNRMSDTDKDNGYTHGYAIAVKNAHPADSKTVQYSKDEDFASLPNVKTASTWYSHLEGYDETMTVVSNYGANLAEWCPAFYYTAREFSLTAPESSSGWFLPSTGQLWDMVANLCGHEAALLLQEWQTSTYNVYYGYNAADVSYDVIAKFNSTIALVPADQKDELFVTDAVYYDTCTLWASSSFEAGETACLIHIGGPVKHTVELMCEYIDYDGIARPIIAF